MASAYINIEQMRDRRVTDVVVPVLAITDYCLTCRDGKEVPEHDCRNRGGVEQDIRNVQRVFGSLLGYKILVSPQCVTKDAFEIWLDEVKQEIIRKNKTDKPYQAMIFVSSSHGNAEDEICFSPKKGGAKESYIAALPCKTNDG